MIELFETYLQSRLSQHFKMSGEAFTGLLEAMDYSVQGGGKRFRPQLMFATALSLGRNPESLFPAATALEWIHTYSLIHDDLPSMDNDDFRRGRPSCHKKFGDATAILAGDALLTEAVGEFLTLDANQFSTENILKGLKLLYSKAGVVGMVGGQALDITAKRERTSQGQLEFIHAHKTGALMEASVQIPLLLYGEEGVKAASLRRFSSELGILFQLADDLLDSKPELSYRWFLDEGPLKEMLKKRVETCLNELDCFDSSGDSLRDLAKGFLKCI